MELKDAIEEIRRRTPFRLNDAPHPELQSNNLTDKSRFDDNHEFVVSLPAWVFRSLRKKTMTYEQRIKELESKVSTLEPHLSKGEAQRIEYRALLKQIAVLERFKLAEEVGPTPNYEGKAGTDITKSSREIYKFQVATHQLDDLFTIPPAGHFGVVPLYPTIQAPKVGDIVEFIYQENLYATGVVVAIESPDQCLRSDLQGEHAKFHWVPFDFYETSVRSSRREQLVLQRKEEVRGSKETGLS